MRISFLVVLIIIASIQGCSGTDRAPSDSATFNSGTSAGAAPTPNATSATLSCGSPQLTAGAPAADSPSLDIALDGNDKTQTFTSGSVFTIAFNSVAPIPDILNW